MFVRLSQGLSYLIIALLMILACVSPTLAQTPSDLPEQLNEIKIALNTGWVLFAGSLVFFMNPGFAMVETGFCRRQNAINVLAKNLIVFCLATVAYWAIGFAIMFGDYKSVLNQGFFLINGDFSSLDWAKVPLLVKFFFQLTFAGTAATIVSGAVAERIKFPVFLVFSVLLVGISYPITGQWVWGGGFLAQLGFFDFAGSTVVHAVGGGAGLMGAFLLRPRLDKYEDLTHFTTREYNLISDDEKTVTNLWGINLPKRRINPLGAHNLSLATLGCLILWFGWFGFNAGSTLELNPKAVSHVLVATIMAGATGGISGTLAAWLLYLKKPSLTFIINGILAGCVSITASCAYVHLGSAVFIGLGGGLLVVWATRFIERCGIDDPVGAIPVHLFCGFWGTLTVGLFSAGEEIKTWYPGIESYPNQGVFLALVNGWQRIWESFVQFGTQLGGFFAVIVFTLIFSGLCWGLSGVIVGWITQFRTGKFYNTLRVSEAEEKQGLDRSFSDQGEGLRQQLTQLAQKDATVTTSLQLLKELGLANHQSNSLSHIINPNNTVDLLASLLKRATETADQIRPQEFNKLKELYDAAWEAEKVSLLRQTLIDVVHTNCTPNTLDQKTLEELKDIHQLETLECLLAKAKQSSTILEFKESFSQVLEQ